MTEPRTATAPDRPQLGEWRQLPDTDRALERHHLAAGTQPQCHRQQGKSGSDRPRQRRRGLKEQRLGRWQLHRRQQRRADAHRALERDQVVDRAQPRPAGIRFHRFTFLHGLAVISRSDIFASGAIVHDVDPGQNVILRWNGSSWQSVKSPDAGHVSRRPVRGGLPSRPATPLAGRRLLFGQRRLGGRRLPSNQASVKNTTLITSLERHGSGEHPARARAARRGQRRPAIDHRRLSEGSLGRRSFLLLQPADPSSGHCSCTGTAPTERPYPYQMYSSERREEVSRLGDWPSRLSSAQAYLGSSSSKARSSNSSPGGEPRRTPGRLRQPPALADPHARPADAVPRTRTQSIARSSPWPS